MNELTLIGHLANPATYHCTEEARDLLRFTLRTGRSKDATATDLHHCQIWGPAALDLHRHLNVGDRLMVRGELRYRKHRNRLGNTQRLAELHVKSYTYLGQGGTKRSTLLTKNNKRLV